jgi:sigma-B regulation protein RsbU (phosphoserine phosphatase)
LPKPSSERLELLYRISQTINSSLDLNTVLDVLIDESIQSTHAERGFLMLYGLDKQLVFKTARGMDARTVEASEMKVSRGIVERVAESGQPLLTSNAQVDERLDMRASVKLYGLRSVLCVPILLREQVLGVVYVDNRLQNGIFSQDDLELLQSLASSAGIAIENARLYQVAVETGRMQRELQVAREVQAGLIPKSTPQLAGWEFAACWKPAYEVSGDFYDFIALPDGFTALVVADVSDKGMPAAMFMALSRSIIRAVAGRSGSPAGDIGEANRLIWQDAAEEMFITLFYARLDPGGTSLTYVNAGHNPPLFYSQKTGELTSLTRTGMAAGVEEDSPYEQVTLNFEKGDSLLIYTDGIVDTIGEKENYGEERLRSTYQQFASLDAPHLVDAVEKEVSAFSVNEVPFDDITLLVIKRQA